MKKLIIALLVLWVVLALLGAIIKGLLWLLGLAVVLFLATAAWGWVTNRRSV